ncbi:MAG: transposase [Rhodocyclaceae bacterium]|nr:transposase [Rhodocyclaceae bacterium]
MSLEKAVSMLKGRSSRQINRHLGHEGALWQAAFHDHALREEEDLREIARYIVGQSAEGGAGCIPLRIIRIGMLFGCEGLVGLKPDLPSYHSPVGRPSGRLGG